MYAKVLRRAVMALFFLLLAANLAVAQTTVTIEVRDGTVMQISSAVLYENTPYRLSVSVLDKDGNPLPGKGVGLTVSAGKLDIVGTSSGTTDDNGAAQLEVSFQGGGLASLSVGGSTVKTIAVYYQSPPLNGMALVAFLTILYVGSLAYAIYAGPVKWYKESRSK